MPTPSPITENSDRLDISILSGGSPINSAYQIVSVQVSKEVNKIPTARIEIIDGSPATEDFTISDSNDLVPGTELEIKVGYETTSDTIFKGVITKQGLKIRNGSSLLVLECRDKAIKMTLGRNNANYQKMKDSDIISQIANTYGLNPTTADTTTTLAEVIQYYATDWDFILSRADINGQMIIADDGNIYSKKPDTTQDPVLKVTYGESLLSLNIQMDATTQLSSIASSSWDISSQAVINATASAPGLTLPGNISTDTLAKVAAPSTFGLQTIASIGADSLQSWANARSVKAAMSKIQGTITFQGSALVKPGKLLQLAGLGERFNGNGFVSAVKHMIEDGNWLSEASIGVSATWVAESRENIIYPAAAGLLPGVQGLQLGQVSQIDTDPDGQFRVLVKIPLTDMKTGVWARLGSPYATNGAGIYFFPELNDEVILGFFNDDPSSPVILGSLYSSSRAAPYTPDSANTNKGIITNGKLKIEFDDVKFITTISTPSNNKITISDHGKCIELEDQNSNSIKMNSDGITINSGKDINITASGNISLSATGTYSASSGQAMTISSKMDVSLTAETSLTASGNASVELSSVGETTIKGTMVMIN